MEAIKEDYLARMQRLWCKLRLISALEPADYSRSTRTGWS